MYPIKPVPAWREAVTVLQSAKSQTCYRDNTKASKDAEFILWSCAVILEAENLNRDPQYAAFLTRNLKHYVDHAISKSGN